MNAVAGVSYITGAGEGSHVVRANGVSIAIIGPGCAFVLIVTSLPITGESGVAFTRERAVVVVACCVGVAN